jgi:hypothetical protein
MTLNVIPPGETVACDDRFACPFCGKLLKEVKGHLSKHFKGEHSLIHAYEELSSKSVIHMYEVEMLSASAISLKIRQEIGWLKPGKGHVLCFLKSKGISPRTTSEAGIQHYAKNPIWNKGLTRDEHPSIAKYGDGRFGSANPIHKTTHEERSKSNYLNKLREQSEEAYQGHCNHISDAVKTWFKDPENKKKYDAAYDNGREKQKVEVKKGIKAYYEKWAKKGLPPPNKTAWCSSIELAVKSALDALAEWGYKTGIARDVIKDILKAEGPMSKEDVVEKVMKERYFKKNTILVNLANTKYFKKNKNGLYTLA